MQKYKTSIKTNKLFKLNAINKLKISKIRELLIANFIEIKPEAIILNFFVGCFLSLFLSIESLIKYIDEERKQNAKKALIETINICKSKVKAKNGAKNISKFLVHCFGLQAKNKFLI